MMVPRSADARFACAVLCRKTLSISSRWRRLEACSPTVCPDTWLHTAAEISWNERWERGWSVVLCDIADLSWKFGIRSSKFWRNAVSVHFLLSFFIFFWKLRFVLSIYYQYSPLVSFNLMIFVKWGTVSTTSEQLVAKGLQRELEKLRIKFKKINDWWRFGCTLYNFPPLTVLN